MEIKFNITKILAVGTDKRFMWINIKTKTQDYNKCVKIDNIIYNILKEKGVPTSQSMRKNKNETSI